TTSRSTMSSSTRSTPRSSDQRRSCPASWRRAASTPPTPAHSRSRSCALSPDQLSLTEKRYDREYFDRWYRRAGIGQPSEVAREARYVLATAEHLLDRPARSVLDVGCG